MLSCHLTSKNICLGFDQVPQGMIHTRCHRLHPGDPPLIHMTLTHMGHRHRAEEVLATLLRGIFLSCTSRTELPLMHMQMIPSSGRLWICRLLNQTQPTIELHHFRQQAGITMNAEGNRNCKLALCSERCSDNCNNFDGVRASNVWTFQSLMQRMHN